MDILFIIYLTSAIVSYLIFCFADHEMDEIKYHPNDTEVEKILKWKIFGYSFEWLWIKGHKWYLTNRWKTKSWWIKNVFTFLNDGWKFWKALRNFIAFYWFSIVVYLVIGIQYSVYISFWWVTLLALIAYLAYGGAHSYLDGSLIKDEE